MMTRSTNNPNGNNIDHDNNKNILTKMVNFNRKMGVDNQGVSEH